MSLTVNYQCYKKKSNHYVPKTTKPNTSNHKHPCIQNYRLSSMATKLYNIDQHEYRHISTERIRAFLLLGCKNNWLMLHTKTNDEILNWDKLQQYQLYRFQVCLK